MSKHDCEWNPERSGIIYDPSHKYATPCTYWKVDNAPSVYVVVHNNHEYIFHASNGIHDTMRVRVPNHRFVEWIKRRSTLTGEMLYLQLYRKN
jgi:hypothetical protein